VLDDIAQSTSSRRRPRRAKSQRAPLLVAGIAIAVLVLFGGWYLLTDRQLPTEPQLAQHTAADVAPAETLAPASAPQPNPPHDIPDAPAAVAAHSESPTDVEEPERSEPPSIVDNTPPKGNEAAPRPPLPSDKPVAEAPATTPAHAAAESKPERWPLPDEAARAAAADQLQANFSRELTTATTKQSRVGLARKLLAAAGALADEQATSAERYALLHRARQLAVEAEDLNLALALADELSSRYAVERLDERLAVYESASKRLKAAPARADLAERLADEGAEALLLGQPQQAEAIFAALKRNIVPFKQPTLKKRIDALAALANKRQAERVAFEQAASRLSADPADPEAKRLMGVQLCLRKDEFKRGLALLAASADDRLAALAELEQTEPAAAAEQAQLADKWWDYAAHAKADQKTLATRRALDWYEIALPQLAGAARKKAETRLSAAKDPLGELLPRTLIVSLAEDCELRLKLIPAGTFVMGSSVSEANRGPDETQHTVLLTRPFYISETELTQLQTQRSTGDLFGFFPGDPAVMPAAGLSWHSCQSICDRLTQLGAARRLTFRLPTEAEWEYACRAGTTTAYSSGDSPTVLNDYAWSRVDDDLKAHPVATRKPNAFGVYDMHGNLNEWCADWYGPHPTDGKLLVNPRGPLQGDQRVWRGGSWYEFAPSHRSAARFHSAPGSGDRILGVRVVCDRAF
jgi:formylglycine-generating enzyme required for sulfatase activity